MTCTVLFSLYYLSYVLHSPKKKKKNPLRKILLPPSFRQQIANKEGYIICLLFLICQSHGLNTDLFESKACLLSLC